MKTSLLFTMIVLVGTAWCSTTSAEVRVSDVLDPLFSEWTIENAPTGILYDRVLGLSGIERFDGRRVNAPVTPGIWRQIAFELRAAAFVPDEWPDVLSLRREMGVSQTGISRHSIAVIDARYNRIPPEILRSGLLRAENGKIVPLDRDHLQTQRVFAVTPLDAVTYRGGSVDFAIDSDLYLTNESDRIEFFRVDFGDGRGLRTMSWDETVRITYPAVGKYRVLVEAVKSSQTILVGEFFFVAEALVTPEPNDTLQIAATVPFEGEFGTGAAYVYLAEAHDSLTNPVVLIEGFDIDNSLGWDELYDLTNQEGLLETLRADGFDVVILDFTDATEPIQRNSFVVAELIQEVNARIDSSIRYALVGASMGGLCSRYALAWLESQAIDHRIDTFISLDTPHRGANIPLGMQYWLDFFKDQSEAAATLLEQLDRPAARQMLIYHHTTPAGTTGETNSLRDAFLSDLSALGDYPTSPRLVSVANGSGTQQNQGFAPGDQVIDYEFSNFLVTIVGNIWAVPDQSSQQILDGRIEIIFFPDETLSVTVSGTDPYDNAPGGYRGSMAQMDSTEAPFGDIVALHDNHCFVPTISALDLPVTDLFYDIAGDSMLLGKTPFDAVYFPSVNQEHIEITSESVLWLIAEVNPSVVAIGLPSERPSLGIVLSQSYPNPFQSKTRIQFDLPREMDVKLAIYDARGRRVRTLAQGRYAAGPHLTVWDGRGGRGEGLGPGAYFVQLRSDSGVQTQKIVLIE